VLAVVSLDFDPSTSLFGLSLRLETLGLAGAILLVLVFAALSAGRTNLVATANGVAGAIEPKLRRDDLILIAFGAVPGAVIGGRLGYALVHFDYYSANPRAITDPGQGGFSLTLAVVLGTLTAITVARLLGAPIGRWLGVAAIPALLGLGLGKLAMVLGGTGQGSYSAASWATSYVGPGPWGSANPGFPAVPSQAIEGGLDLALAVLVLVLPFLLRLMDRPWRSPAGPGPASKRQWAFLAGGRRFLTVLGLWAVVRFAAAFTWRDARVVGPLVAEQVVLLLVAVVALFGPPAVGAIRRVRAASAAGRAARRSARAENAAEAAADRLADETSNSDATAADSAAP